MADAATIRPVVRLAAIWLGWVVLLFGFQALAPARFVLERPDHAIDWVAAETSAESHLAQPTLLDPFLKAQVAWDSEYYLSIALHGYDDPAMRAIGPDSQLGAAQLGPKGAHPGWTSLNYAFFPGYPLAIRALAWPLAALGMAKLPAAILAGVAISLAGTFAAMLAVADLAAPEAADEGLRAAFYLLVWPTSVFLAQVYSEGLFLGLSFGALAMMRRKRWGWAAALAVAATLTRATGFLLLVPFAWTWLAEGGWAKLRRPSLRLAGEALLVASPALAYLAWRAVFGSRFEFVETRYYGRGPLWLASSWTFWTGAWSALTRGPPQAAAYRVFEFAGLAAASVTSLALLRRRPALSLYGLAVLGLAMTSGAGQGLHRYALALPALFLAPARWGRALVFDRLWTLACVLGLAILALAFSVDFWAG